jgi:hypothetical protein
MEESCGQFLRRKIRLPSSPAARQDAALCRVNSAASRACLSKAKPPRAGGFIPRSVSPIGYRPPFNHSSFTASSSLIPVLAMI